MTDRELTCQELTEVLTDYLEGVMAPAERERLEAHLDECDACVAYVAQMHQTLQSVRALREREAPAPVPDELLEAFAAFKRGGSAGRTAPGGPTRS